MTVLLAVRNGEPYLREALDSVFAQTFRDFELLVVDDASDDGTEALLAGIEDERLRVVTNRDNIGQVPSLNLGLEQARGEYVARLDHDDVCLPERLERQVAVLDAEPQVAVVGSWATLVDEAGHVLGHARQSIRDYVDFVYWNLAGWVLIPHPSAVFRRDVVLELGGYDPSLAPSEDKDLWRKIALRRLEGRIVEEELIRYRLHTTQLSRVQEERQQRNDEQSHRAFLKALAGDAVDLERLRLLLRADPRFFRHADDAADALADLDSLLAGTVSALRLDAGQQERLDRLVGARVARCARSGWKYDVAAWRRGSGLLARRGRRNRGIRGVADAAAHALLVPLAPVLYATARVAREAARTAVEGRALRPLRGRARRSPLARRIYSRLLGRS